MLERSGAFGNSGLDQALPVPEQVSFSVKEAIAAVFAQKRRMLAGLVVPPVIALLLIIILPPTYKAETALLVKTGREYVAESPGGGMGSGPTITKLEEINSELELMDDRSVIEQTINEVGMKTLYPGIVESPPRFGSIMDAAVKKFRSQIDIKPVKMSNIVDVTFSYDDDRALATKVLDTYVAAYLQKHAEVFSGDRSASFEDSLRHDSDELTTLEHEQARIKLENRVYDVVAQRAALITQRVDAQTHLQDTVDRRETLQQRLAYLTSIRAHLPGTQVSTESSPSDEAVKSNETLAELKQTETALLDRYSPDNPNVRDVQNQIAALQSGSQSGRGSSVKVSVVPNMLPQQVDQELVMDRAELAPLGDEATRYESLIDSFNAELQRIEKADTDLRMIQSQIDALSDNTKSLRALYDVARTQDEMDRERLASVVQVAPAETPLKPDQPAHLLFGAAGILAGLLVTGGLAVWAIVTNKRFLTQEGLETRTGLRVLVSVPLLRPHVVAGTAVPAAG